MKCETNSTNAMSKLCLEAWENGYDAPDDCFLQSTIGTVTSIWCMINGSIGFTGNLLTLLAIPYAAKKKKSVSLVHSIFKF